MKNLYIQAHGIPKYLQDSYGDGQRTAGQIESILSHALGAGTAHGQIHQGGVDVLTPSGVKIEVKASPKRKTFNLLCSLEARGANGTEHKNARSLRRWAEADFFACCHYVMDSGVLHVYVVFVEAGPMAEFKKTLTWSEFELAWESQDFDTVELS